MCGPGPFGSKANEHTAALHQRKHCSCTVVRLQTWNASSAASSPTSFINNLSGAFWNPCVNSERQIQIKTMIVLTYTTGNCWNSTTGTVSDFKTDRMCQNLSNLGSHILPLSTLYLYTKCLCWLNMSFISLGFHPPPFSHPKSHKHMATQWSSQSESGMLPSDEWECAWSAWLSRVAKQWWIATAVVPWAN